MIVLREVRLYSGVVEEQMKLQRQAMINTRHNNELSARRQNRELRRIVQTQKIQLSARERTKNNAIKAKRVELSSSTEKMKQKLGNVRPKVSDLPKPISITRSRRGRR